MIYVPPYPMSKRSKLRKDVHGVPNKLGVENQQSKKNFVQGSVAEPPKLYGLYVLVIVLKTSNNYTCIPQNLRSLSGVLRKPESSTIYISHRSNKGVTTTLQHLIQNLHQSAEE
jgi:hypothetical protein